MKAFDVKIACIVVSAALATAGAAAAPGEAGAAAAAPEKGAVCQSSAAKCGAERRRAFAEEMVKAMRNFDDLYPQEIRIDVVEPEPGKATVEVKRDDAAATAALEGAMGIAVANFAIKYPGIRFLALEDGTWRVLIPDDVKLPQEGGFDLAFP